MKKKNVRILLKFTVGLPVILFATFFISLILFFAWILGDDSSDWIDSIEWLWKARR